jgi:methyl-accepting chemotaxis protein
VGYDSTCVGCELTRVTVVSGDTALQRSLQQLPGYIEQLAENIQQLAGNIQQPAGNIRRVVGWHEREGLHLT